MKVFLTFFLLPAIVLAQNRVESRTYHYTDKISGSTTLLQSIEIHPGIQELKAKHAEEELVIVKDGHLKTTINGSSKELSAGSIAYIMPNDEHSLECVNNSCSFYVIHYSTGSIPGNDKSPTSFTMDWNEMKFVPHDKGGRRDVVDKRTVIFNRFEMHITTLNPGLPSHDPHSHTPEEIILIKEGDVEMSVGDKKVKASTGDYVFVDSKVFHGLTNIGKTPSTYFAFQWN